MIIEKLLTHSTEETEQWAERFAQRLQDGDVAALRGELGAGKTVIARGIGRGLGVREQVISPTFNYVLEYEGRLPLFHADLYRIDDAAQFVALGLEEYFHRGGIFLIEWAERIESLLPKNRYDVLLELGDPGNERRITVTKHSL
ncbi:tRNA (adenosine(37)-N6)-threonylcarbamoyltransferase complex ATPase subunit type 1 TsaE [bacterium]|nr:tRNA (adenosine(37)-N6)-threonylcarbamoyltransferase complex ATPase subunit type 1 TsaE [bacterium]